MDWEKTKNSKRNKKTGQKKCIRIVIQTTKAVAGYPATWVGSVPALRILLAAIPESDRVVAFRTARLALRIQVRCRRRHWAPWLCRWPPRRRATSLLPHRNRLIRRPLQPLPALGYRLPSSAIRAEAVARPELAAAAAALISRRVRDLSIADPTSDTDRGA